MSHAIRTCAIIAVAAGLFGCTADQPLAPSGESSPPPAAPEGVKPLFNHAPPIAPDVDIDVNNYTLTLRPTLFRSGDYKGFPTAFFAGGLAYGNAPDATFISHAMGIRSPRFLSGLPIEVSAGPVADHQTVSLLLETTDDNIGPSNPIGLAVVRETFAFVGDPDDDYVMVKYTLTNTTTDLISGLHIGEILDIDLGNPRDNVVEFVADDDLARTTSLTTPVSHGHILLSDLVSSYRGFCNDDPGCPHTDPATLAGWFTFLSSGIVVPGPVGPSDTRELLTTGPVNIPAGGSQVLFTALLGGDDAADLSVNVTAARTKFATLTPTATDPFPVIGVEVSFRKFKAHSQGAAVATLTFGSRAEVSLFDDSNVSCDGVSPREASAARSKVTLKFNVTDFDTQRIRDGDRIVCAGKLTDGTLYGGTTILAVEQKLMPVTQLTSIGTNFGPTWSPDGNSIAFVSERDGLRGIWRIDLAAGEASAVELSADGPSPDSQRHPDWSPDGSTIAFARDGGIFTVPAAGGPETQLTTTFLTTTFGIDQDPRWSPDGTHIVFRRGQGAVFPFGNHLWVMTAAGEIAGSPAIAIAANGNIDYHPDWAADGLVYFTSRRAPVFDVGLFRVDPLDPEPVTPADRVTPIEGTDNRHTAVSPDGQTLAFLSNSSAGPEIVLQDLGTGEHTVVPLDAPVVLDLSSVTQNIEFSPDGKQIVFAAFDGTEQIYVVDISKL